MSTSWRLPMGVVLAGVMALSSVAQDPLARDIGVVSRSDPALQVASRFAVVVGINRYAHTEALPPLGKAERDARDVAAVLDRAGFKVILMTPAEDPRPLTKAAILSEVERTFRHARVADTILFYFSGHGFSGDDQKSYLCAYATDPADLRESALWVPAVEEAMRRSSARKRLIVVDACRNIPGKATTDSRQLLLEDLKKAEGTGYLFSTAPNSRSYEVDLLKVTQTSSVRLENGLFTHFLLAALAGSADANGDGFVTFRECAYRVDKEVREASSTAGLSQTPWMLWDGGAGDDVLLVDLKPPVTAGGSSTTKPPEPGPGADARDLRPPTLRYTNQPPAGTIWPVGPTELEGTVDDESWPVVVNVNGVAAAVDAAAKTWRGRATIVPGDQTIVVSARDAAGNEAKLEVPARGAQAPKLRPGDVTINWIHDAGLSSGARRLTNALSMLRNLGFNIGRVEDYGKDISDQQKTSRYLEDEFLLNVNPNRRFVILYSEGADDLIPTLEQVFSRKKWSYVKRKASSKQRDQAGPGFDRTIDVFGDPR